MKTTSAFAPARSSSSISLRNSVELDVLVLHGEVVDAAVRRREPAGDLAGGGDLLHQRMDERAIGFRRDPFVDPLCVLLLAQHLSLRIDRQSGPGADGAAEARGGQGETQREAGALDLPVPALEADLAVLEV